MRIAIIDPHVHMDTRSANDYELMAISGVETIVIPSTYTGERRFRRESYFQYYDRLLKFEKKRAESFGIECYIAVAVDPEDLHDISIAYDVIERLPEYFTNENVCAMGEIGLEKFMDDEISIFLQQLRIAHEYKMPVILHTPHNEKAYNLPRMLEILAKAIEEYKLNRELLLLDDLTIETLSYAWKLQLGGYGIAVSPILNGLFVMHRKASPLEVKALIDQYGCEKIIFNSALGWGFGDPLAISRSLLHLKMMGEKEDVLQKLAYENARRFFSQCPNFHVKKR